MTLPARGARFSPEPTFDQDRRAGGTGVGVVASFGPSNQYESLVGLPDPHRVWTSGS